MPKNRCNKTKKLLPDYGLKYSMYEEEIFCVGRPNEIYSYIQIKEKLQEIFVSGVDWEEKEKRMIRGDLVAFLNQDDLEKKPLLVRINEVQEFSNIDKAISLRDYRFGFANLSTDKIISYYKNMFFGEEIITSNYRYFLASFDYLEKAKLYVYANKGSLLSDFYMP